MREVSKTEFLQALETDKRDIIPSIVSAWDNQSGYTSEWRTRHSYQLFGKSQCGDNNGSDRGKKYWLV
jgi:hypothetical protein